jgi:hypothetical protein
MKKRAIGEVTGPYRFLQLIWVVLTHPEYDWDVVVRYVDGTPEAMEDLAKRCEMSGLFKKVYICDESTLDSSMGAKIKAFMKLGIHYITFRKQKYFDKFIIDVVGQNDYQLYCPENSFSMLGCAFMHQHKKAPIIILEDGSWDYVNISFHYKFPVNLAANMFFYMHLLNSIGKRNFKLNEYAIKYASNPDNLSEKNFKEIRKLYNDPEILPRYRKLVADVYEVEKLEGKAVVFGGITASTKKNDDIHSFLRWLEKEYKGEKVYINTHPRDSYDYKSDVVNLSIINRMVPGELFYSLIDDETDIIFTIPSTMIMNVPKEKKIKMLRYDPSIMYKEYQKEFDSVVKLAATDKVEVVDV